MCGAFLTACRLLRIVIVRALAVSTLLLVIVACSSPAVTGVDPTPTKRSDAGTPEGDEYDTDTGNPSRLDAGQSNPPPSTGGAVNLRWNSLGNYVYSLDVKTSGGDWIGPCLDTSIVGSSTSISFTGVCTSAANQSVPAPAAYRLYYSRADERHWQDYVEATPSGMGDVVFNLPTSAPSKVDLSWNMKSETAEYSLDVMLVGGQKVAPCVNSTTLVKNTSYTFDGNCSAPPSPQQIDLKNVADFIICWAEGGNWAAASCAGIPYTGFGTTRMIPN